MTRYLISFDDGAMDHLGSDLSEVGEAAHRVLREAKAAGVWVSGGGLFRQQATIVDVDGTVRPGDFPETKAVIGGFSIVEVPTLDGKMARINIPAGAQSGHQFRLRAKGMPVVRSTQKGDMYIEIGVETPVNLTAKQKELLKEFEQAGKTSPESEGFFSKMKELFSGGN